MNGKALQRGRIILAGIFFMLVMLAFLGIIRAFVPQLQFLPAVLAAHGLVILGILILTFFFGRIYCSVICPLGIWQDIILWLSRWRKKKRYRFAYRPEKAVLRYVVLGVTALAFFAGLTLVPIVLDPYSIFGRTMGQIITPFYQYGFNGIAAFSMNQGGFLWESEDIIYKGTEILVVSGITFLIITFLAWKYGRLYCQTICPVGTILGTVSRYNLYGPVFAADQCVSCGICEKICRSSCIDVKNHRVEYSRCIDCFDCVAACPHGAIRFIRKTIPGRITENEKTPAVPLLSRRDALIRCGLAAGAVLAAVTRGSLPVLPWGKGKGTIMPPGALSYDQFTQHCTACQLCSDRCPSGVLMPAIKEYGMNGIFQPHLDFSKGYCAYNCNFCSQACPSGAIHPLTVQDKQKLVIGKAVYYAFHCIINEQGVECGNCARHCPQGAITMKEQGDKLLPVVHHDLCIGCGACQYYCPANPKAITVRAVTEQHTLGDQRNHERKS